MDIILSISLLASNRRKSLERCLDSLKPLLIKIPSELIIVLTAADPEVREIAEKYTPQIIPFRWCDDFSAARNAGLKEARGEWFLYIDDDEWFDDVEEICHFFLSGEYRHYQSAHYIQRNYQNWNGTEYSDFSAFRMIRRLPESRFQGAIHEELIPRLEPCRQFQTCVHHYGYARSAGDYNGYARSMENHSQHRYGRLEIAENTDNRKTTRNIRMLTQSIRKYPDQIKNYIQIAKEFDLEGDWKTAADYCRKGRRLCHKSDEPHSAGWLQAYLSGLLSRNPGTEQSVLEIESILRDEHPFELTCLILYQHLICLCANGMEPEKAVIYGQKFEKLLDDMDRQAHLWEEQSYGEFGEDYVKNPRRLYDSRMTCTACALETQSCGSALFFFKRLPWDKPDLLSWYYPDFERWKQVYPSFDELLSEFTSEYAAQHAEYTGHVEMEHPPFPVYLLLQQALRLLDNGETEEGKSKFMQCVTQADSDFLIQVLLKEVIYHQMYVPHLAAQMNLDTWDTCLAKVMEELPHSVMDRIQACEEELGEGYPFHRICLRKHRIKLELSKGFPLWEELTDMLEEYCFNIMEFYKGLYREEMFWKENSRYLPDECQFASAVLRALDTFGKGQMAEAVRLFGEALHLQPSMTGVITEFFRQAARQMDNPACQAEEEFRQLAGQMKDMVNTLLAAGQTAQAEEILDQLLPLLPEDLEVIRIRQELIRRRKS